MPTVTGGSGPDFIHTAGDGLIPPDGYTDVTGVSDSGTTIVAGDGDDIVYGGAGRDIITGGQGADALYGGGGYDTFVFNSAAEIGLGEIVDGGFDGGGILLKIDAGDVNFSEIVMENITGISISHGSAFSGVSLALSADQFNSLTSIQGSYTDTIVIEDGISVVTYTTLRNIEQIQLSSSDDQFQLRNANFRDGTENFTVKGGSGNDDILLLVHQKDQPNTLYGEQGDDTLSINEGIAYLDGGKGADRLEGGKRADTLIGGKGQDLLNGGAGGDLLTGGADADTFLLAKLKYSGPKVSARDTITDFNQAEGDRVDLSRIDADAALAGDQAFHLGGGAFTGTAGELIQTAEAGGTLLSGDINGDGTADFAILFATPVTLTSDDFWF
jgi:Ca2+-binding RTX toxin-like protein